MLSYIGKLQKKPEATRRKILYASVFVCAGVIFGVWATTLPARLAGVAGNGGNKGGTSPIVSLKEAFGGIFSDFSSTIGDIKDQTGAIRSSFEEAAGGQMASSTDEMIATYDNIGAPPQTEETATTTE